MYLCTQNIKLEVMKRLFFAMMTVFVLMSSCERKPSLAGSEFSNPNIVADGVDEMWVWTKHTLDSIVDTARAQAIIQAEAEAKRALTTEELAELDNQLDAQVAGDYENCRHQIDSLKAYVKVTAVLKFKDEEHMNLSFQADAPDDNSTDNYDGTYSFDGKVVVLTYGDHKDSLRLSDDGKQLSGRLENYNYESTLTKVK